MSVSGRRSHEENADGSRDEGDAPPPKRRKQLSPSEEEEEEEKEEEAEKVRCRPLLPPCGPYSLITLPPYDSCSLITLSLQEWFAEPGRLYLKNPRGGYTWVANLKTLAPAHVVKFNTFHVNNGLRSPPREDKKIVVRLERRHPYTFHEDLAIVRGDEWVKASGPHHCVLTTNECPAHEGTRHFLAKVMVKSPRTEPAPLFVQLRFCPSLQRCQMDSDDGCVPVQVPTSPALCVIIIFFSR